MAGVALFFLSVIVLFVCVYTAFYIRTEYFQCGICFISREDIQARSKICHNKDYISQNRFRVTKRIYAGEPVILSALLSDTSDFKKRGIKNFCIMDSEGRPVYIGTSLYPDFRPTQVSMILSSYSIGTSVHSDTKHSKRIEELSPIHFKWVFSLCPGRHKVEIRIDFEDEGMKAYFITFVPFEIEAFSFGKLKKGRVVFLVKLAAVIGIFDAIVSVLAG